MMGGIRFAIVGAGIAGASLAYRLAEALGSGTQIALLGREDRPGYHSTGRSAAVYTETYGPPVIRALTAGSRPFFDSPPPGFSNTALLHPLGMLLVGGADRQQKAEDLFAACHTLTPSVRMLETNEIMALVPVMRPECAAVGVFEPDAMSMDVAALHEGYLRGFRTLGGVVTTDAEVLELNAKPNGWQIDTRVGSFHAEIVINAAGAWADALAGLADLPPLGLQPKRRTALVFKAPDAYDTSTWPMINDIDETFYFKPDAGRILASPEEAAPMPPCDVQPDELDIAITVDRIQRATTMDIAKIDNRWAGLRSFFDDGVPTLGFDPRADGFFWLAGQGGYGITTSDAMAQLATSQLLGHATPSNLVDIGVDAAALSPSRF